MEPMPARTRKLIGSLAIVGFLALYIVLVATLAEKIPPDWKWQLPFFVVAGLGWGGPLLPLISWMNKGRD